ncbi:interaptin isoform X2 [Strongylocentrotus purpuratus]|uniref:Uncharacterized protein n=1 Tax=Strongylocentrotus purpuratus TaxID=7668 RepID=A0A7M7N6Z1_STRPU|nr:interaptin isoform X2 [Strongylocentrotus purpuratus]
MDQQRVEEIILEYASKKGMTDILAEILERRGMESFQVLFLAPLRLFLAVVLVIIKKDDVIVFRRVINILKMINKKIDSSPRKHLQISHSTKIIRELKRRIVLDKMSHKETAEDAYDLLDKYFPYSNLDSPTLLQDKKGRLDRFHLQDIRQQLLEIVHTNEFRHHVVPAAEKEFLVNQVKHYVKEISNELAPTQIEQLSSRNGSSHYELPNLFDTGLPKSNRIYKRLVLLCMDGLPSEKDLHILLRDIWNYECPKEKKTRRTRQQEVDGEEESVELLGCSGEDLDVMRQGAAKWLKRHKQGALLRERNTSDYSDDSGKRFEQSRQGAELLYLKIMREVIESDDDSETEQSDRDGGLNQSRRQISNKDRDHNHSKRRSHQVRRDLNQTLSRRQSPDVNGDLSQSRRQSPDVNRDLNQLRRQSPDVNRDLNQSRRQSPDANGDLNQSRRQSPDVNRDLNQLRRQSPDANRDLNQSRRQSPRVNRDLSRSRRQSPGVSRDLNGPRRQSPDVNRDLNRSRKQSPGVNRDLNQSRRQSLDVNGDLNRSRRQSPDVNRDLNQSRRQSPDVNRDLNQSRRQSPDVNRDLNQSRRQSPDASRDLNQSRRQSPDVNRDLNQSRRQSPDVNRDLNQSRKQSPGVNRDLNQSRRQSPCVKGDLNQSRRQPPDLSRDLNQSRRQSPDVNRDLNRSRRQSPDVSRDLNRSRRQSPDASRDLNQSRRQSPRVKGDLNQSRRQSPCVKGDLNQSRRQSPCVKGDLNQSRRQPPDVNGDLYQSRRQSPDVNGDLNQSRRQPPDLSRDLNRSRRQSPDVNRDLNQSRRQSPDFNRDIHQGFDEDSEEAMDIESSDTGSVLTPDEEAACEQRQRSSEMDACTSRLFPVSKCFVALKDCTKYNEGIPFVVACYEDDSDLPERAEEKDDVFTEAHHQDAAEERRLRSSPSSPGIVKRTDHLSGVSHGLKKSISNHNVDTSLSHSKSSKSSPYRRKSKPIQKREDIEVLPDVRQRSPSPSGDATGREESFTRFIAMLGLCPKTNTDAPSEAAVNEVTQRSEPSTDPDPTERLVYLRKCSIVLEKEKFIEEVEEESNVEKQAPVLSTKADSDQEMEDQSTPFIQDDNEAPFEQAVTELKRTSAPMNGRNSAQREVVLPECSIRLLKYKVLTVTHSRRLVIRNSGGPSIFKRKNYKRMSIHIPGCGRVRLRHDLPASGLYM